MDDPVKMDFSLKMRKPIDRFLRSLNIPKVDPNKISGSSLVLSVFFPISMVYSRFLAILILFLVLVLDYLDGFIAREYGLDDQEGYIVDVAVDRVSEGLIFLSVINPWFFFFALNNLLTIVSFKNKRHVILPLRHFFLVFLIFVELARFL